MKKAFFLLTLVGFLATQANAMPTKSPKIQFPKTPLARQLAKYITYPDVLKQNDRASIVVIQFRVNEVNELCQLTVFSQNSEIDNALLRQLTGKKLVGYGSTTGELHTVRLRFLPQ